MEDGVAEDEVEALVAEWQPLRLSRGRPNLQAEALRVLLERRQHPR